MKKMLYRRLCVLFAFLLTFLGSAFAFQAESFDFTGATRTELVKIKISADEQFIEHITPSREAKYSILSYDITENSNGDKIFTATVVDEIYNVAFDVLLYINNSYADIRIGNKRLTFSSIRNYRVVAQD
mgnify:CR=1 FL=1